jgi:hypothetical protein
MLRIHQAQIDWFAKKSQADFIGRMDAYLRETFPERARTLGDLPAWLRRVVDRALRAEVKNEPEVAQLMLFFLLVGLDDPEHRSWVDAILADKKLLAVGKARKLVAEARKRGIEDVDDIDITSTLEDV